MRVREMPSRLASPLDISVTRYNERREVDCWFLLKVVCRITNES